MVAAYSREDYGRMATDELRRRLSGHERAAVAALPVESLIVQAFYAHEIRAALAARQPATED